MRWWKNTNEYHETLETSCKLNEMASIIWINERYSLLIKINGSFEIREMSFRNSKWWNISFIIIIITIIVIIIVVVVVVFVVTIIYWSVDLNELDGNNSWNWRGNDCLNRCGYEVRNGYAAFASVTWQPSTNSGIWHWPTLTRHSRGLATEKHRYTVSLTYYYTAVDFPSLTTFSSIFNCSIKSVNRRQQQQKQKRNNAWINMLKINQYVASVSRLEHGGRWIYFHVLLSFQPGWCRLA